jgi:HK97 family phage major capsid protein/HK97 family phage prohead protease
MTATLSPLRPGEMLHRTIDLGRAAVNATERTVEIAFSSEAPVERYFGSEILDHSPKSVRLGRLNNGGAVLVEHDRNRQIGVIVSARIDADRVGRAVIRFGKGPLAEEIFQDVKDGIRRLVSVGYQNHKIETESKTGGVEAVRVVDWEPFEISIVSIPADQTVGVGRGLSVPTNSNFSNKVNTTETTIEPAAAERNRTTRIIELASVAASRGMTVDAHRAISEGATPEQFQEQIYQRLISSQTPYHPGTPSNNYGERSHGQGDDMSLHGYSVARAIRQASKGRLDGLEGEVSAELSRRGGIAPSGFLIPSDLLSTRAGMSVTGDSGAYGNATVATAKLGFIQALRPYLAVAEAGATILDGLSSNIDIPRQSAASTASWKTEVAELDERTPAIDQVELRPRRVGAFTVFSKQLLAQSSNDVEGLIRQDLMMACATALDAAAVKGGGTNEPSGILSTAGIGNVIGGTNGLAPAWTHIVQLVAKLEAENVTGRNFAFVINSATAAKLRATPKVASTDSAMILEGDTLLGHKVLVSGNVPGNLVKGSSGAVCSALIFGNFADVLLGSFGPGIDIIVDGLTLATSGRTRVIANYFCDIGIRNPKSFAAMLDALTA